MMRQLMLLCFLLFLSSIANAHVKWFVDNSITTENNVFKADILSFLLLLGALVYIGIAAYLEHCKTKNTTISSLLYKPILRTNDLKLLKAGVIIFILGNIIQSHFIAPNLKMGDSLFLLGQLSQAALIILIVFFETIFCIALIFVSILLFYIFGFSSSIDYFFELLGISLAVYFFHKNEKIEYLNIEPYSEKIKYNETGIVILRISLGLQLCALAIQDKLINPSLSLGFLGEYPHFNFMNFIGIDNFTNIHFVLAAGLAEFSMGLLLVFNFSQRIGALTALFFFSITSVVLGPSELFGHIPVIIALLIVINKPVKSPAVLWKKRLPERWQLRLNLNQ